MRYFIFFVGLVTVFTSCNLIDGRRIKGNGKITTKNYDLKGFHGIDIGGSKKIFLKQDSAFSVKIETDENLFDYLNVRVDNGQLKVSSKNSSWLSPSDEIKIFISMPSINEIDVNGASSISTENRISGNEKIIVKLGGASEGTLEFRAPVLDLKSTGASTLTVSGETRDVKSNASGASTINSFDLKSENSDVKATGASSIDLFASVSLNANASGASNVNYKGNPSVKQNSSGASEIKKADR